MNKVLLIAGALLGCLGGVSGVACSSGGGTGGSGTGATGVVGPSATTGSPTTTTGSPTTTTLSGSTTGMGGAGPATTTGPGPTTTTSGGGAGGSVTVTSSSTTSSSGECSKVTTLHPPNLDAGPGTIYCPFSAVGDGGKNEYCTPQTQHCCEITCTPPCTSPPSTCEAAGSTCPTPPAGDKNVDWQCEDPVADCPSGQVCCAPGASIGLGTPGCGNFAHTMTGTACVANAAACTGIVMCTSDSECPSGMTCTPFGKGGNDVGGCM